MHKQTLSRLALSVLVLTGATAAQAADPVQWTLGSGGNGHYYLYVDNNVTWQDALAAASTMTWAGLQGHLATITSAGEDNFAGATAAGGRLAWIAASDDGHEGSWTWRAGPESGQALTYFNWSPGEPNNCCNGENYVHLNWGAGGSWNDHGGPGNNINQANGYLVEFSAPVPEPTSALLSALGLGALVVRRRLQSR